MIPVNNSNGNTLQQYTASPHEIPRELCDHNKETRVNILLPNRVLFAALEQAEMYHWGDLNGLLVEAITAYLHHRDALPAPQDSLAAHPDMSTEPVTQGKI